MPDYQKGKIYRMVNDELGLTYYGSTTQKLSARKASHKTQRSKGTSKQLFQKGNVEIVLVENFPCDTKEELLMRERYYIENNDCVNRYLPITTPEEKKEYDIKRREENKEQVKTLSAQWYQLNKEKAKIQKAKYREENKEKMKKIKAKYYQENKEKLTNYTLKYNLENKEKIKIQQAKYYQANKIRKAKYYQANKEKNKK